MIKFHLNKLPSAFLNFSTLVSSRHKYKTRLVFRSTFYIPLARTNYGKFNIRFKEAIRWNNIDESLKSLLKLSNFKLFFKRLFSISIN